MFQRTYHKPSLFSQFFLIVSGISFVLSLFKPDTMQSFFAVIPANVTHHFEIWRVVTFPFASANIESFIMLTLCVGLFLPIIESTISTSKLFVSVMLLFISQGLLYSISFNQQPNSTILMGADSMSFYTMAMYTFLQPHKPISLWKNVEVKGMFVVVLLSSVSFLYSGIRTAQATDLFYYGAINSAFGVLFAVMITFSFQRTWRIFRFRRMNSYPSRSPEDMFKRQEELVPSDGLQRDTPISFIASSIHLSDEEMLDQILDKIFEHGQDSLLQEERQFLEDYSQRMR